MIAWSVCHSQNSFLIPIVAVVVPLKLYHPAQHSDKELMFDAHKATAVPKIVAPESEQQENESRRYVQEAVPGDRERCVWRTLCTRWTLSNVDFVRFLPVGIFTQTGYGRKSQTRSKRTTKTLLRTRSRRSKTGNESWRGRERRRESSGSPNILQSRRTNTGPCSREFPRTKLDDDGAHRVVTWQGALA